VRTKLIGSCEKLTRDGLYIINKMSQIFGVKTISSLTMFSF